MNDRDEQKPQKATKQTRSRRQPFIIAGIASIGVIAVFAMMNLSGLSAQPDVPDEDEVADNNAPAILGLEVSSERISPTDVCTLVCEAGDADGDRLIYTWSADNGDLYGEGKQVQWGAPDVEGLFRVSVTVDDGRGGTDDYSASLRVKKNSPPEFLSVPAFADTVGFGEPVALSCSAEDPDGDEVSYEWQSSNGELFGEGNSIIWLAPEQAGSYVVKVTARDAYSGHSQRDILLNVLDAAAPQLGEFIVTPIGHDMLDFKADVWDIFIGRSCSITCVVREGDAPLTYEWTADNGTLTTDGGDTAEWQAPDESGPAAITVDVTDVDGHTTTGVVLMYAEDCTCKF